MLHVHLFLNNIMLSCLLSTGIPFASPPLFCSLSGSHLHLIRFSIRCSGSISIPFPSVPLFCLQCWDPICISFAFPFRFDFHSLSVSSTSLVAVHFVHSLPDHSPDRSSSGRRTVSAAFIPHQSALAQPSLVFRRAGISNKQRKTCSQRSGFVCVLRSFVLICIPFPSSLPLLA